MEILLKIKNVPILLIAFLIFNLSHTHSIQAVPKVQFTIVYTNDVMGEVEPCG
jgi:hypothetical protein